MIGDPKQTISQASGCPARRLGSRPAGRRRRQPSQHAALTATIGHKQVGDKHHHYYCEDEREVTFSTGMPSISNIPAATMKPNASCTTAIVPKNKK